MKKIVLIFLIIIISNLPMQGTEFLRWNGFTMSPNTSCGASGGSLTVVGSGGLFNSNGGNGSEYIATNWNGGSGTKYWRVNFSTTGWTNITVSWQQYSTCPGFIDWSGPKDFKLQYSTDNIAWFDVAGATVSLSTTKANKGPFNLPVACENQSTLYLRWIMTSNSGLTCGSGTFGAAAQSMIDEIAISGDQSALDPTDIALSGTSCSTTQGVTVGTFTATDANCSETFTYSLVAGIGSTNNSSFSIVGDELRTGAGLTAGSKSIRVRVTDGTARTYEEVFTITVSEYPVVTLDNSGDNQYNWITNVTFGTINNSTGQSGASNSSGYSDYSAQSTNVAVSTGYPISVTLNGNSLGDNEDIYVFVDWNGDKDFSDANEKITIMENSTDNTTPKTYNGTINVPVTATAGNIRMRVVTSYAGATNGDIDYGEVEDYTLNVSASAPEISISGNGTVISDGDVSPSTNDHTDFGTIAVDGGTQLRTFTITNSGTGNLTLTNPSPYVSITGHTSDFTLTAIPSGTIASGGGTTTFSVTFNPTTTGTRSASISIANDDSDENPYNFNIQGVGFTSPTVTTNSIANIMTTQAQITSEITSTGGQNATTRGVAINTSGTPTTTDAITSENGSYGTGTYNLTPNTLTSNTLYYVRAYATNGNGTSYGNELTFTTTAVVAASPATSITAIGASVSSEITVGGAADISAKGICWNTTGTPTTADDKTSDGTGTGVFSSSMTGLNPGTTYFVRAYATNAGGTSYSNQISFTTEELSVAISNVVKNTDTEYQLTADINNPTSEPILAKGYVWSTSQNPTTTTNSGSTSNGTGSSSFTDNATITVGPGYYVRAYITTAGGTFYSDQVHFGVVPTLPEWAGMICSL